jgi:ketosteroid isomerase-like protein
MADGNKVSEGSNQASLGAANIERVRKFIAGHEAKDPVALMQFVTEDTLFEMPFNEGGIVADGHFRTFKGVKELDAFFKGVVMSFAADDHMRLEGVNMSIANEGRTIFVECRGGARMKSGRQYRNRYLMRFDFRDGKILRLREYYNPIATAYAFERLLAGRYTLDSLDPPAAT